MGRQGLDIVQILRAGAAIAVTLVHFSQLHLMLTGQWPPTEVPLYSSAAGVDVFFVISGFIMVFSSQEMFQRKGSALLFLSRRIARLVPLYWLTTAIAIAVEHRPFTIPTLLMSYFFIPFAGAGGMVPLYGVGWTLNYEMYFYALFAVVIALPQERAVLVLGGFFVAIVTLGSLVTSLPIPIVFWSDPIILEFVLGMVVALAYRRGVRFPTWLACTVCAIGIFAVSQFAPNPPPSGYRILQWGFPAAMVLAGAVLRRGSDHKLPFALTVLGDASYSIYLIHILVVASILNLWPAGLNAYPVLAVLVGGEILTILLSIATFYLFERPMTRMVRRLFSLLKPVSLAQVSPPL